MKRNINKEEGGSSRPLDPQKKCRFLYHNKRIHNNAIVASPIICRFPHHLKSSSYKRRVQWARKIIDFRITTRVVHIKRRGKPAQKIEALRFTIKLIHRKKASAASPINFSFPHFNKSNPSKRRGQWAQNILAIYVPISATHNKRRQLKIKLQK